MCFYVASRTIRPRCVWGTTVASAVKRAHTWVQWGLSLHSGKSSPALGDRVRLDGSLISISKKGMPA